MRKHFARKEKVECLNASDLNVSVSMQSWM